MRWLEATTDYRANDPCRFGTAPPSAVAFTFPSANRNPKRAPGFTPAALVIGERDHWTAAAQQLLAAFILFVVTEKTIPPNKKDLKTVRTLLLGGVRPTLEAMKQSTAADGLLSLLALSFLDTPEKEFGSILSRGPVEEPPKVFVLC